MVGTPSKMVARSRWIAVSTAAGVNRGISDIVQLTTIVDIYSALVEARAYRVPFTHAKAFAIMEQMKGKLDPHLLQAFRPVTLGAYQAGDGTASVTADLVGEHVEAKLRRGVGVGDDSGRAVARGDVARRLV